jgi:GNAT superfamily N-acetyltransferase
MLRKASRSESEARDATLFTFWGGKWPGSAFQRREEQLNDTAWSRQGKATRLLPNEEGTVIASCDTFQMETLWSPPGNVGIAPLDLFLGSSVFVNEKLRGKGIGKILMEQLAEALAYEARPGRPFALAVFSDVGPAGLYKSVGMQVPGKEETPPRDLVVTIGIGKGAQDDTAAFTHLGIHDGLLLLDKAALIPIWKELSELSKAHLMTTTLPLENKEASLLYSILSAEQLEWHLTFRDIEAETFPGQYNPKQLEHCGVCWMEDEKDGGRSRPVAGICWTLEVSEHDKDGTKVTATTMLILSIIATTEEQVKRLLKRSFMEAARCGISEIRCWDTRLVLADEGGAHGGGVTSSNSTNSKVVGLSELFAAAVDELRKEEKGEEEKESGGISSITLESKPRDGALPMVVIFDGSSPVQRIAVTDWRHLFRGTWN